MKRQSFLKGSAVLLAMVFVTKALGLLYKIPLTSMLGGSGMSCYSGAFAVFTPMFALAAGGVTGAVSRLISEQLAMGKYKNAVRIRRTASAVHSAAAVILTVLLVMFSGMLADRTVHIPDARWAVMAVALSLLPASLVNVRRGWAEGLGSMTPTASSEIVETVCKLVLGLAAPYAVMRYAEHSYELYHGCFGKYCSQLRDARFTAVPYAAAASALAVSAASLCACIYIHLRTRKLTRECRREFAYHSLPLDITKRQSIGLLLSFSIPASLTMVVASLSGMADLVTISPCLEAAMRTDDSLFAFLGSYGIAAGERSGFVYGSYTGLAMVVFGLVPTFTAMLGKSILPSLTAACARRDTIETERSVSSLLLLSSAISMPCGAGICILPDEILRLLFFGSKAECAVSARPLGILGAAVMFMGIALPCLTALQACSRQLTAMVITLGGTVIKLVLNMVLIPIPALNICGAAISTLVSQAVVCIAAVTALIKGTKCGSRVIGSISVSVLPASLCGCGAFLMQNAVISRFEGIYTRFGVLLSLTIGAIICMISYGLLCISPKNQLISIFVKKFPKNS